MKVSIKNKALHVLHNYNHQHMLKQILLIALLYCFSDAFGQTPGSDLSQIKTIAQAEVFAEKNPKANARIFTIESNTDTSEILLPLFNKKNGFTFSIDNNKYKILQIDSVLSFRVSYIYLNGQQLTRPQIDSLRQEIISSYKKGTGFFDLVQQYNMDGNISGDTGWFTEGMMVTEFEKAVRDHKKGDIFTVDTPGQNWYHVVLKTYGDTYIKKLTILKTQSSSRQ
jgi:PPIC-type PPIASE domain